MFNYIEEQPCNCKWHCKGLIVLCRMRTVQAQGAIASTPWEESIKMLAEGQGLGMRSYSSYISKREKPYWDKPFCKCSWRIAHYHLWWLTCTETLNRSSHISAQPVFNSPDDIKLLNRSARIVQSASFQLAALMQCCHCTTDRHCMNIIIHSERYLWLGSCLKTMRTVYS